MFPRRTAHPDLERARSLRSRRIDAELDVRHITGRRRFPSPVEPQRSSESIYSLLILPQYRIYCTFFLIWFGPLYNIQYHQHVIWEMRSPLSREKDVIIHRRLVRFISRSSSTYNCSSPSIPIDCYPPPFITRRSIQQKSRLISFRWKQRKVGFKNSRERKSINVGCSPQNVKHDFR